MKFTYTLLLVISLCTFAYTQDTIPKSNNEKRAFKHALGLFGSIDSGLGISYRYSPNNFRFQVTTLPMYVNFGSGFYFQFLGLALQYRYYSGNILDLYTYLGGNSSFAIDDKDGFTFLDLLSGGGFGVDFKLLPKWMLQFQVGYGYDFRDAILLLPESDKKSFIAPGFGIMYNFGRFKKSS